MEQHINYIEVETQALALRNDLTGISVIDQASYDAAVEKWRAAKEWLKAKTAWFDDIQKPAYAAYKSILDKKKQICGPAEEYIKQVNNQLLEWDRMQESLRREEQRRLEAEARERAENERLALAEQMQKSGADDGSVSEVLAAPIVVTEIEVAQPTYEKSSAVVYRDNWSGEVVDLFTLVKAVAKDRSKLNLLSVNQTALNSLARALKETMNVPGVRAVNKKVVATGRG